MKQGRSMIRDKTLDTRGKGSSGKLVLLRGPNSASNTRHCAGESFEDRTHGGDPKEHPVPVQEIWGL
eukprot:8014452-Prorocentrum_lima.AAC.1